MFRRREMAERERRERERLRVMREREERENLMRERQRLEMERQKLERERMERERLERERIRIEQVSYSAPACDFLCLYDGRFNSVVYNWQERRKEAERLAREREELRRQQEQLRYEQEKRNNLKRGRDVDHRYSALCALVLQSPQNKVTGVIWLESNLIFFKKLRKYAVCLWKVVKTY